MKTIETIEDWNVLSAALKEKGYSYWQNQYDWYEPQGFHIWFWKSGKDVEVVTHCNAVQDAMIDYKK